MLSSWNTVIIIIIIIIIIICQTLPVAQITLCFLKQLSDFNWPASSRSKHFTDTSL